MLAAAFLLAAAQAAAAPPLPPPYAVPPTHCYASREIALDWRDGARAIHIAGSLTAPRGGGPRPTIVMITGSGDHIRDQIISGVPMFGLIADFLARAGYNVVRTDARGFGGSTIDGHVLEPAGWMQITSPERYRDNRRLLDWLATQPEVARGGLILLGHSEGAMLAARLAADRSDIALTVLLSDSTIPGNEVFAQQRGDVAAREGAPPAVVEKLRPLLRELAAFLTEDADDDARFEQLVTRFQEAQAGMTQPVFDRDFLQFHRTGSPWHIWWMGYDPYPDLARIHSPVLAVYGDRDDATPWRSHAPVLARALAAAGNPDFTLAVLPDEDHFFLEYQGHRVDRHPWAQTRISNELQALLLDQLARRFGPHGPACTG